MVVELLTKIQHNESNSPKTAASFLSAAMNQDRLFVNVVVVVPFAAAAVFDECLFADDHELW